jgi:hypothetical protein
LIRESGKVRRKLKDQIAIEVYNPAGAIRPGNVHAPRLATLNGKTICELADGQWRDEETFPIIRHLLQERFPDAKFIPFTEFPTGQFGIDADGIEKIAKRKGCDAVIVGNAG